MTEGLPAIQCGACTRCCHGQMIVLHPERGDDPKQFVTRAGHHPITGRPAYIIPNKPDGSCHYLGDAGCEIWGKHPVMCQVYDCRSDFLKFKTLPRPERRRLIKAGLTDPALIERGRELVEAEKAK